MTCHLFKMVQFDFEEGFALNPLSGRLMKKGTHTYNRIFSKRGRGRPRKEDSLDDTEATCYVQIPNTYINPDTNKPCMNYRFKM